MRGVRSLSGGLFIGLIIAATVFGALVLSVRGQPTSISELPIPTVTLQIVFTSPTPALARTPMVRASIQPAAPSAVTAPAASVTPTPAPTICPIPPHWQRYSVGPFDTVLSIAQRFNLAPDQLVQTNCLAKPGVTVGQTIYVPGFGPTPTSVPCFPPSSWSRYVVRPGDTLSSIAMRYSISVYTLMRANCLSTTFIYYGQVLYVPPTIPIVIFTPPPIIPTLTLIPPVGTFTPTPLPPADTPTIIPTTPAITVTPGPTDTPGLTTTPLPLPTDTPAPPTGTPIPPTTGTPIPPPDTPIPPPADTPIPPPADTPIPPPADTPIPPPVDTPVPPPANTPEPLPMVTALP